MTLTAGNYYRTSNANSPTVDSLFLIEHPDELSPVLPMFQMAQNPGQHDAQPGGGLLAVGGLDLPRRAL